MLTEKQADARNKYMREYMQRYREANREKYNEYMRDWRAANKDKVDKYRGQFWDRQAKKFAITEEKVLLNCNDVSVLRAKIQELEKLVDEMADALLLIEGDI